MSSELARAYLRRYQPEVLSQRLQEFLPTELNKGCDPILAPVPVALEPPFFSLRSDLARFNALESARWTPAPVEDHREWQRRRVWISPDEPCDWTLSERFLKQVSRADHRLGFELAGNGARIEQLLLFHQDDEALVLSAFSGELKHSKLTPVGGLPHVRTNPMALGLLQIQDFYPWPPYTRLLTRPEELRDSIYGTIVSALGELPSTAFGLVQVLFQPAHREHDWHYNVKRLIDVEFELMQSFTWAATHANAHQTPGGYIANMAEDAAAKAHTDKPFFFTALRVAVGGRVHGPSDALRALGAFVGMIRHGGHPLRCVEDTEYRQSISAPQHAQMLTLGHTFRPGFLLNSEELTTLAHFTSPKTTEFRARPLEPLEPLAPSSDLSAGVQIGVCRRAGKNLRVCLPLEARSKHMHVIGRPGTGKSLMMEHMMLQEIAMGHGVALIDPHGPLVDRLLRLIPEDQADRVIYVNPGDRHFVPIWNPLHCDADHDLGRVATDLLSALESITEVRGNRLAHLMRHALFALLHIPGASLREVNDLLRKGSTSSDRLIRLITGGAVTNDLAVRFWEEDFPNYGKDEIRPPQHVLGKLLVGGTAALMLSQPDSAFNLRAVMEEGRVLLFDLHNLGAETRDTLGSFLLALLHETAIGRCVAAGELLKPFHIYCDEFHRFMTAAVDDMLAETRKFSVSLTLAHQFMKQFGERKTGALSSVASTVIFNVDREDATYLKKDLLGRVDEDDLITQGVGQAIARIGTDTQVEIVRLKTLPPRPLPTCNQREAIIAQSRRLYCKPVDEVIRTNEQRHRRGNDVLASPGSPVASIPEPEYEEL